MDVEESPESSKKYMIISIPTVIFFKDGKEVSRFVGVKSFKDISSIIDGIINS
jgi:thioredoxin 1